MVRFAPLNCLDLNRVREHGVSHPALDDDKGDERDDAEEPKHHDECTAARPLDECIRDARESNGDGHRTGNIRAARTVESRVGDMPVRDPCRDRGERQIDQKDESPRNGVDQPSAEERSDRARHAGETGPRAHGLECDRPE